MPCRYDAIHAANRAATVSASQLHLVLVLLPVPPTGGAACATAWDRVSEKMPAATFDGRQFVRAEKKVPTEQKPVPKWSPQFRLKQETVIRVGERNAVRLLVPKWRPVSNVFFVFSLIFLGGDSVICRV